MTKLIFKDSADAFVFGRLMDNKIMREILIDLLKWMDEKDEDAEITAIWRDDPGSTHYYFRALDLVPATREVAMMEEMRTFLNDTWDYGKGNIQVVPGVRHGTAPHIHIQVRGETHKREKEGQSEEALVSEEN